MNDAYLLPVGMRKWYIQRFNEQKISEEEQSKKQEKFVHPLLRKQ